MIVKLRHVVAAITVPALVAGMTVALSPSSASAATTTSAAARSRFLSGSLLLNSVDLDSVVALGGVSAASQTGQSSQTATNPLDLTALNLLNVAVPGGISLPLSQFLNVGAVNQYAQATPGGAARAAAGAVADSGAVDTTLTSPFPSSASIDLASMLGAQINGILTQAALTLGGITGVAATGAGHGTPATTCTDLSAPVDCRDYTIARGTIDLTSPLVGTLISTVGSTLDTVSASVDSAINTGIVTTLLSAVNGLLGTLNTLVPGLSVLSNNLSVSITTNLRAALNTVLTQTLSDGLVSIDLSTGTISVDLDALVGGLNNLPPNTQLLSAAVINDLIARIGTLIDGLAQQITNTVTTVLDAVNVTISGGICLLEVVVCTAGLDIAYSGSLADLVSGATPLTVTGTGLLSIVGPVLSLVLSTLQSALGLLIGPILTGGIGSVTSVVTPAVTALTTALDPVLRALTSVLSLVANVQEPGSTPNSYREVAVRAIIGSGAVATVDLARVEVSAQAVAAPTPGTTTPAPGTTTPGTTAPHTPAAGDPSTPLTTQPHHPRIDTGLGANAHGPSRTPWLILGALLLALAAVLARPAVRYARAHAVNRRH